MPEPTSSGPPTGRAGRPLACAQRAVGAQAGLWNQTHGTGCAPQVVGHRVFRTALWRRGGVRYDGSAGLGDVRTGGASPPYLTAQTRAPGRQGPVSRTRKRGSGMGSIPERPAPSPHVPKSPARELPRAKEHRSLLSPPGTRRHRAPVTAGTLAHARQDPHGSAEDEPASPCALAVAGSRVGSGEDAGATSAGRGGVCPAKAGVCGLVGQERDAVRCHRGGHAHGDCPVCPAPVSFGGAAPWWPGRRAPAAGGKGGTLTGTRRGHERSTVRLDSTDFSSET